MTKPRDPTEPATSSTAQSGASAITTTISTLDKQFGKGAILCLGDPGAQAEGVIPTGSIGLDAALGIGGYPRGRIVEIFGPESSGKTTLALHAIAETQHLSGIAAMIDAEHTLDLSYARSLGVDASRLLVSQPDTAEQALEIVEALVRAGAVQLIVIDSIAALSPRAEVDGETGDEPFFHQARLMSQALRKLTAVAARQQCCILILNPVRPNARVRCRCPETTPGTTALKFYASVRLEARRQGTVTDPMGQPLGSRIKLKVVKNKLAAPFREAEIDLLYGAGIDRTSELLDLAVERGLVEKSGWYRLDGERLGHGREQATAHLKAHPELEDRLAQLLQGAPEQ